MESGIIADVLVCRTEHQLSDDIKKKIALFCNVKSEAVIQSIDAESIYDVPLMMYEEGLDRVVLKMLSLPDNLEPDLSKWKDFLRKLKNPKKSIKIGLVGKYVELQDSYKSILESLIHAGAANEVKVNVDSIHSEELTNENCKTRLQNIDGLLVAPGFGNRGIEGKISAIKYVRENKIPFFGICLGMQMAVIEYSRNILGLKKANSTEMDIDTEFPVIDLMENQKEIINKGGTMRLGAWDCKIEPNSRASVIYNASEISERHRHRYELNNKYLKKLKSNGLNISGVNTKTGLAEIIEIKNHPWFIGVQFHPEYKSTVLNPHPLFKSFIKACCN
jgi:CTP synthase